MSFWDIMPDVARRSKVYRRLEPEKRARSKFFLPARLGCRDWHQRLRAGKSTTSESRARPAKLPNSKKLSRTRNDRRSFSTRKSPANRTTRMRYNLNQSLLRLANGKAPIFHFALNQDTDRTKR